MIPLTMTLRALILPLVLLCAGAFPQNAPLTSAGRITNAVPAGTVTVPVTVRDFVSIGGFTLTLRYRVDKATWTSATPNPAFPGMTVTHSISGSIGKLVIHWPQTPGGITLPDGASLIGLNFTYIGRTTVLSWSYSSGNICQYYIYSNGSYTLAGDNPKSSYYINGGISDRGAPVTTAATVAGAVSGSTVSVPVTVTGFDSIGSMYLQLDYDSTALTFQSLTPNASFGGAFSYGVANASGTVKRITVGWYGSKLTLADQAVIYTVQFLYTNTPGKSNHSGLTWFDNGPSCQYADGAGDALIDAPTEDYYKNGLVFSQYAAKTWLPAITGATPGSPLDIPVNAMDFSNISSFNLTLAYDTTAFSYTGFTANAAFGGAVTVTNTAPAGSKRTLVIHWPGTAPLSLAGYPTLVTLHGNAAGGATALAWVTNDATSCRFNDAVGNAYCDLPKHEFYRDGLLATQVAPLTVAGQASPAAGQQVTVPLLVYGYANIGDWSLVLDYDPGVLTYVSSTATPVIGGVFQSTLQGAGRLALAWTGAAASLPDSTALVSVVFTYIGGESALAWYDNGASCRYAFSPSAPALYDQPAKEYYINGYVGPNPLVAGFTANNLLPPVNQTITFTDQSNGSPTAWKWIIQPSAYRFDNGTGAASQHPQVAFDQGGAYTVTLIVYRGNVASSRVRTNYIHAGTPGLWTGRTSAAWATGTNWDNHLVPAAAVNVLIPTVGAGQFYPVVSGNLVMGTDCRDIQLTGQATLTVTGLLTVGSGTTLDIRDTATVTTGE